MNIINKFFLGLALAPARFYKSIGVNTYQLKAILTTKLTMDERRPNAISQARKRKKAKPVSMATVGTMLMSAVLGAIYLLAFSIGNDIVTQLTFYFTLFFIMLSLTLIADFTSVLIDVRDNLIILPKPVSDRTFVVARLLHIFIHICKIVLPMCIAGIVLLVSKYGFTAGVIFLLLVFLLTAFSIFFINALYILILKLTTPQRFQSIISSVQIIFAILIYGSYQIFPRMITQLNLKDFDISKKEGIMFYPIYWLAQSWNVLYNFKGSTIEILMAAAGLLLPVISVVGVVKYLAPSFNKKLALITNSSGSSQKLSTKKTEGKTKYSSYLSSLFTSSAVEKASFEFTWKMTARSRDFKLKVYPSIGYLLVYVVVMFINNKNLNLSQLREESNKGKVMIISALYLSSLMLVMAINQVIFSEKFKASWIYYTTPLSKPGEIISGAAKAAIAKFYIPLVLIITTVGVTFAGIKILPNIILGLFNEILIASMIVYAGNKLFPFSVLQSTNVKTGSFLKNIFVFSLSGIIAVAHFFIYNFLPVVIICAVLSIIASWLMMDSIKKISWKKILSKYAEE